MHPLMTNCGLQGIAQIPYGVHMCSFYRTRAELADTLVPYFAAGLRANERCIWVTAEPLPASDALAALDRAGIEVREHLSRGALTVRDFGDWYADAERLKGNEVIDLWLAEERRALELGYSGLRITGNVTFLRPADWPVFMEYEELVNRAFEGRRILTLCTYRTDSCGASEMFDVMERHTCALDRPDDGWQILPR